MTRLIFFTFFCLTTTLCFAQTQAEMNNNAAQAYKKAESQIDAVYQRILKEYKSDATFINKLRIAQRSWIQFRDAELEARYPENEKKSYYGSLFPICYYNLMTQMTQERTRQLQVWLKGVDESDACSGSVKIRN